MKVKAEQAKVADVPDGKARTETEISWLRIIDTFELHEKNIKFICMSMAYYTSYNRTIIFISLSSLRSFYKNNKNISNVLLF